MINTPRVIVLGQTNRLSGRHIHINTTFRGILTKMFLKGNGTIKNGLICQVLSSAYIKHIISNSNLSGRGGAVVKIVFADLMFTNYCFETHEVGIIGNLYHFKLKKFEIVAN